MKLTEEPSLSALLLFGTLSTLFAAFLFPPLDLGLFDAVAAADPDTPKTAASPAVPLLGVPVGIRGRIKICFSLVYLNVNGFNGSHSFSNAHYC